MQHHITANSTFSWWGAWMSTYSDKIITTPKVWVTNGSHDTRDLLPKNWIQI